ncbi:hypothetical protein GIB67_016903 [Kingdonia uniflora]|uniref:K Homology domain-containing protein n=1 Tax=Kingdonia uniflora TaxID=39325 RepID=A0A7J7M3A7_9MAGN|nr:hypothetical protein GIB67_016903 [Kingdonia uniflora]
MATKVEQASSVEPHHAKIATTSSTATVGSSKVSRFGVKSGFVIPKNKLSGALVPGIRSREKVENRDVAIEESTEVVQRKTKWGTDLTQDASVRRGRALAYQTRVEQITQQLKSEILEKTDDQGGSQSQIEVENHKSSSHEADDQKLKILDLERREVIGELLKLNPSYKTPPDYKPLLKEAKVPIPLKVYPGYNFISLILGSGSNTQKRLQEETGAKITIRGIKAGAEEKDEVTLSDGNEVQSTYEDLYVHVSADTFEKVDAAVSLIELLVTPVSGKSVIVSAIPTTVSGDSQTVFSQSEVTTLPSTVVNQGMIQPMVRPTQPGPPQVQFQPYRGPWFPNGPSQTPLRPPTSGFIPPVSSAPMPQFLPSPYNPSSGTPFLGGRPSSALSFGFGPPRPQQPNQVPQMRNNPMLGSQASLPYPTFSSLPNSFSGPYQVTINQPRPTGQPTMYMLPPVVPNALQSGPLPNRPFPPNLSSSAPSRPPNMIQTSSQMFLPQRPQVTGPPFSSAPPRVGPGPSMMAGPPSTALLSVYPQAPARPPNQSSPLSPIVTLTPRGSAPNLPLVRLRGSTPIPLPVTTFTPVNPQLTSPVTTPKPQHPSSGDFTFQPLGVQKNDSPLLPKLTIQSPSAPLPSSFRPALPSSVQVPPPLSGSVIQFSGNPSPNPNQRPPKLPTYLNPNNIPLPQMNPRGFMQQPSFPSQIGNPAQMQQNLVGRVASIGPQIRQGGISVPHQNYNHLPFPSGVNQVYDPFSPTSVSSAPPLKQGKNPVKARKQENDPEYEDLMESVGMT